jgi:hypothetical protein
MQTKLHRIDELMRNAKDRKYSDGDYAKLAIELDDLKSENEKVTSLAGNH